MEKEELELSIVMPCLNEADTLATCIQKAHKACTENQICYEIVVADNGSEDGSIEIAEQNGARVEHVKDKGYGSALMGGIAAARGTLVIMGDADDSYDFLEVPKFVHKLREGYDLVQGCRLPAGGGTVARGAMPFLHRWLGNPLFSFLARWWFRAPIHDIYCGLRGFRKTFYESLKQRCSGMEFATEMMIKSSLAGAGIAEVPITLHPDGRRAHAPHLKTFRDGWRTFRYFLMSSPRWLFLMPGCFLVLLGLVAFGLAIPKNTIFDAHTMLFGSLAVIAGYQAVIFAVFAKTFAGNEGLLPVDERITQLLRTANLERCLVLSALFMLAGGVMMATAVIQWLKVDFGGLNYSDTMRIIVPGMVFIILGLQTLLSRFFISILEMAHK